MQHYILNSYLMLRMINLGYLQFHKIKKELIFNLQVIFIFYDENASIDGYALIISKVITYFNLFILGCQYCYYFILSFANLCFEFKHFIDLVKFHLLFAKPIREVFIFKCLIMVIFMYEVIFIALNVSVIVLQSLKDCIFLVGRYSYLFQ